MALAVGCVLRGRGPATPDTSLAERFAAGAASQEQSPLSVQVRALTGEEGQRYFGGSLKRLGVQPVWLRVRNDGDGPARYLPILTDPNYFSPQEVAQLEIVRTVRRLAEHHDFLRLTQDQARQPRADLGELGRQVADRQTLLHRDARTSRRLPSRSY